MVGKNDNLVFCNRLDKMAVLKLSILFALLMPAGNQSNMTP